MDIIERLLFAGPVRPSSPGVSSGGQTTTRPGDPGVHCIIGTRIDPHDLQDLFLMTREIQKLWEIVSKS